MKEFRDSIVNQNEKYNRMAMGFNENVGKENSNE